MTENHDVNGQSAGDLNLLSGGDQKLETPAVACSTKACWPTRIMRGMLAVAVLGAVGAYGALQANPNLANYVPFVNEFDSPCSSGMLGDHCPLTGCPLSAASGTKAEAGCCSASSAALASSASEECPHSCPLSKATESDAVAVNPQAAAAESTPAESAPTESTSPESAAVDTSVDTPKADAATTDAPKTDDATTDTPVEVPVAAETPAAE
jgi:hypothetical protein